jgi:hypothetical protein
MRLLAILSTVVLGLLIAPAMAQDAPASDDTPESDYAQPQLLDKAQLDQLVAPIALYPDALLSQVLIASTYPLEVVQAARWAEANKGLTGAKLDEALAGQDWDDSIKSLVAVPNVLSMMNDQLDWTTKVGDTLLAQQADVMDAIQRLRLKAQANGKLESTEQQKVSVSEPEGSAQPVVVIEQAAPETVYVPYYDPAVVYGPWPYPDYQPYYFRPGPGWVVGGAIATGIAWSAGFAIGNAIWGDGFDWRHNDIRVNVNRNVNINNKNVNVTNWQHNSVHRRGVSYNNTQVKNKFANANIKSGDKKLDFRGRGGEQVIKPGAGSGPKPDLGGKLPGQGGLANKKPDLGGKGLGQGNLANKKPDLGGKGPGQGNLANKKPDLGGKGPGQGNLANKKPDLGGKKPNLGGGAGGAKPRPGGGAFDVSDGGKAKDFSKRGHASLGDRGSKNFKKPAGKPKSLGKPGGGAKAKSIGRPGGGHRKPGGGGGKRRR